MKRKSDVDIMYEWIIDRVMEAVQKAEDKNWNGGYAVAFSCGLGCDIERALKKIKRRWKKEKKK